MASRKDIDAPNASVEKFMSLLLDGRMEIPLNLVTVLSGAHIDGIWNPSAFISARDLHSIYLKEKEISECGMIQDINRHYAKYLRGATIKSKSESHRGFFIRDLLHSSIYLNDGENRIKLTEYIKEVKTSAVAVLEEIMDFEVNFAVTIDGEEIPMKIDFRKLIPMAIVGFRGRRMYCPYKLPHGLSLEQIPKPKDVGYISRDPLKIIPGSPARYWDKRNKVILHMSRDTKSQV